LFPANLHTFVLEWTDDSLTYSVDGNDFYTIQNEGDWTYGPVDVIFNLAIGGSWSQAIAERERLDVWRGIELDGVGQTWEMVVKSFRYYPLRDPDRCQ